MSEHDTSNWAAWIGALSTGAAAAGALIVAVLKSFFVTHAQMRQYYQERDEERLRMHNENKADMRDVKADITAIKEAVTTLKALAETGRWPRIDR